MIAMLPAPRRVRFLLPGQLIATAEPTEVTTIVGSCLAVCLWDEAAGIGGINHFVLPFGSTSVVASNRFGSLALDRLLAGVEALGARRARLQAGVYGGACGCAESRGCHHVGAQNAELATSFLARYTIPVIDLAVGGQRSRKLLFTTDDGIVTSTWIPQEPSLAAADLHR